MDNKIYYKKGYKYQLTEDFEIQIKIFPDEDIDTEYIKLTKEGLLFIRKGYAWDGPSGPTYDTKSFMRGSLVHDALYQLIRMGELLTEDRALADLELKEICIRDNMNKFYAKMVYRSIRVFGKPSANPKNKHKIESAP
jgi:hypothetical protein